MTLHGPVLVGTDLSTAAEEALRQGAQLASALDTRLLVCHVIPELLPAGAFFAEFRHAHADLEQSILAKARAAVEEQLSTVLKDHTALEIVLDYGTPHAGLLSAADEKGAGTIVVAPGAVAVDIARHASGAVLVARRTARGSVLGATDFSHPSLPVLHVAAAEARRRGVPLHLLHVLDPVVFTERRAPAAAMPYLEDQSWIALEGLDELRAFALQRLEDLRQETGVPGEVAVLSGFAPDVIIQQAEAIGAELVVVGTHGRSGLQRLTLGSTAATVIEQAPSSVLVMRLAAK